MIETVASRLEGDGLALLGGFHPEAGDQVPGAPGTVLMVGNIGSALYPHLQASPEMRGPQPLDSWTRRVLGQIAEDLGVQALFPFDGPPFHPFQRWAIRADRRFSISPLGLLVHETFGLWTALRGALLVEEQLEIAPVEPGQSPCLTCAARPCLSACPVDAFQPGRYDVTACRAHLSTLSGQDCMMGGCLARRACPVGRNHAYTRPHAGFHMRAFRAG
ncbi:hypothetical protein [Geminicoccus roseus]|uniref:hypothetical protein n=1 Tax=Geminicoccus roseus TaxID=404900 RepID=UPI0003F8D27C|nr:hypothetical protein [Geminicoccus roseus]